MQLRELTRTFEDLVEAEGRLTNRLRDQLYRVHAPWLTVSPAADEPWLWTLLADAPHPERWAHLGKRHLAAALKAHRIRPLTPEALLNTLRQPTLTVAPEVTDTIATPLATLVPQLRLVADQRRQTAQQMDALLEQLADGPAESESRPHL